MPLIDKSKTLMPGVDPAPGYPQALPVGKALAGHPVPPRSTPGRTAGDAACGPSSPVPSRPVGFGCHVDPALKVSATVHAQRWADCKACPLSTSRTRVVLWRGTIPCQVVFVGEAPGPSEDLLGLPFVGPLGRVLDDIISTAQKSIPFSWCITNVVACLPMQDGDVRKPKKTEINSCWTRLWEFLCLAQPRLIVTLGDAAASGIPTDLTLSTFPPARDWPEWGFDVSNRSLLEHLAPASHSTRRWKPAFLALRHPGFMIRQRDPVLETKRAVTSLVAALEQLRS